MKSFFVLLLLGLLLPFVTYGQSKGMLLRDQNLVLISEDDQNVFNLVKTSVKPYQNSSQIFTFDLRKEYKIADKVHPEDIGLEEHYLVWCDSNKLSPPSVRHIRDDGLIGAIEPYDFNLSPTYPAAGTYQRKAVDYLCNSNLASNNHKESSPLSNSTNTISTNKPDHVDISKLIVLYQPNADTFYPSFSKRVGEQGAAVVRLIIDKGGRVEDVEILQSSKYSRLDNATLEIGKKYKFMPFLVNGEPQRISTNLIVKFYLVDSEPKGVKPKFEQSPISIGG
jgi:TonB family protein